MPEAADGIIASSRLIPVEWVRSSGSATLHPRLLIGRHPWGRTRGGWTRLSYGMYVREAGCPPRRDAIHRVSHRPDGLGGAAFLPPTARGDSPAPTFFSVGRPSAWCGRQECRPSYGRCFLTWRIDYFRALALLLANTRKSETSNFQSHPSKDLPQGRLKMGFSPLYGTFRPHLMEIDFHGMFRPKHPARPHFQS